MPSRQVEVSNGIDNGVRVVEDGRKETGFEVDRRRVRRHRGR